MPCIRSLPWIAASIAATVVASAQTSSDWRIYGATKLGREEVEVELFYLKSEIQRTPEGHLLVWTKGLAEKALQEAIEKAQRETIDRAARKVITGYIPPVFRGKKPNQDQVIGAISFEEIANEAEIQPSTRILYEIDCSARRTRELSLEFHVDGTHQSKSDPRPWSYVPPESNGASLFAAVCEGTK